MDVATVHLLFATYVYHLCNICEGLEIIYMYGTDVGIFFEMYVCVCVCE